MPWGRPDYVCQNIVAHVSLRHRFAYEVFTANVEEEERDFRHALDMSAAIELGNESPIATSSDDDEAGPRARRFKPPQPSPKTSP